MGEEKGLERRAGAQRSFKTVLRSLDLITRQWEANERLCQDNEIIGFKSQSLFLISEEDCVVIMQDRVQRINYNLWKQSMRQKKLGVQHISNEGREAQDVCWVQY